LNADRRTTLAVCIALLQECNFVGEITEQAHDNLTTAIKALHQAEFWQLKNQERHEGKNAPTDKQIAICRVALPALQEAVKALEADDFDTVVDRLTLAGTTDGTVKTKKKRRA
jgi:hypothetical protein